jgi:Zn-dependent peptidase ImmA (M78 family)
MTHREFLAHLRGVVEDIGSQAETARRLRISRSYLNHLLAARRLISPQVASALGYDAVLTFEKRKPRHAAKSTPKGAEPS